MQLNKKKLVFAAAWIISAVGTVYPQRVTDHLHRLVEMSARRLAIAEQIALAKWDSGTPVEDASREAQSLRVLSRPASREAWIKRRCRTSSEPR
jgi:chorismate mutase